MCTTYRKFLSCTVGLIAAGCYSWSIAQETQEAQESQELEEIIVVGQSIEDTIPLELMQYGNRVEIITADELEKLGFIDVGQALQMLAPGLHLRPKNGPFDYFDASIHGSRGKDILWLVDSVRITNRLYNGTSPLDTIPAHMVERIEILKGGQGIFYGTQSVGGVVNIVTKSFSNESGGEISLGAHTNDGYNLNGYYKGSIGDHQFVAYASKDDADGYQPYRNEDFQPSATDRERGYDIAVIGLKYGWNSSDKSRLSAQYQHSDADLDYARAYGTARAENLREEDIVTIKWDYQINEKAGLFIKAYHHTWDTRYDWWAHELDDEGNMTGDLRPVYDMAYWGYEDSGLNAMAKFDLQKGFEYVVGLDHQTYSAEDEVWRIADLEEDVTAAYVQVRTTSDLLENSAFAFGVRYNDASNSDASSVWNVTGKHHFSKDLYLRGNIGTSFRLPDAEELFLYEWYDEDANHIPDGGWFAIGNPDLKPEESLNINLAVGGNIGNFGYELIGFRRDITDYIDAYVPVVIEGVEGETFENSDDEVNIDGLEVITSLDINADWSATLSYINTRAELNDDGTQLTGIPESEIKFMANYRPERHNFGLTLSLDHVGDINARRGVRRGNYSVIDLSGYYLLGASQEHRINVRLENLADEEYTTIVHRGTLDSTGNSFLYDNLGMVRTFHVNYSYKF